MERIRQYLEWWMKNAGITLPCYAPVLRGGPFQVDVSLGQNSEYHIKLPKATGDCSCLSHFLPKWSTTITVSFHSSTSKYIVAGRKNFNNHRDLSRGLVSLLSVHNRLLIQLNITLASLQRKPTTSHRANPSMISNRQLIVQTHLLLQCHGLWTQL